MKKDNIPPFESWPVRYPNKKTVIAKISSFVEGMKKASTGEEAYKVWKQSAKYSDKIYTQISHISVLYSINTQDKKLIKLQKKMNQDMPEIEAVSKEFSKAVLASPHREYLEKKLGSFYFQMAENALKGFSEAIIPEMIKESELTMQYGALIASAKIEFRGETYNLSQMGKFMEDLDRNTRKEAAEAYYGFLSGIKDQLEDIYDQLVKVRDTMAKKLGYKSYTELGYINMQRYDYTPEEVAAYREAIRESVTPLAGKIAKAKLKRVGIKKPQVYDMGLAFKDGNPTPLGSTADKVANAQKMYDQISEETSYFFNLMVKTGVLDLEAKPGKQSGGYMTFFPTYKIPFIFSNFNGTSGDVDVLTHEFGHSFQYCMSRDIKIPEYRMPTMEACEIDSMSMEFFAEPYMDLFFDDPVKYRYLHLADSISFLPYGVTVDEFQHWVYENPNATPAERDAKWHELEVKYTPYKVEAYGDCEYMATGHRWLTQGHIFSSPFYYIDYTLAQVMAFQFFNLDRKNHEKAWKKYVKLCKMGGKYPFRTLIAKAGLKDPFKEGVVKSTIKPLVKQLNSYNVD